LECEADLTLAESQGAAGTSDLDLHGNFDSIVNLDRKIALLCHLCSRTGTSQRRRNRGASAG
jgi:hypothetical protein